MNTKEWSRLQHNSQLDIEFLRAYFIQHAFPRHTHDYYVISLILQGRQSFTHLGTKYYTPPGGLIFINPDVPHTGEAVDENGFEMLCLYPTAAHMQKAVLDLSGRPQGIPHFKEVRVDHPGEIERVAALYQALAQASSSLECEEIFTWTLIHLIRQYADMQYHEQQPGQERNAVQMARRFIDECFAQDISLSQLAEHVSLSPYYFLRVFRAEMGIPPYVYLESVRVREAKRLIKAGKPLSETALEVGFSSQSHLTYRFKQIVGVTPGQYAHNLKA